MIPTEEETTYKYSRIYLIGMPGVGKTTLGKKLARELSWKFIDLDDCIEKQSGLSIAALFQQQGEAAFRELEQKVLMETIGLHHYIIACGGGTAAYATNMDSILSHGLCLYLKAPFSVILDRIKQSKDKRPLFTGLNEQQKIEKLHTLFDARVPIFERAQLKVSIPTESLKDLKNKVLTAIQR